jgi:hypothetical protein
MEVIDEAELMRNPAPNPTASQAAKGVVKRRRGIDRRWRADPDEQPQKGDVPMPKTVRAKFQVTEKTQYAWNKNSVRIKLTPQYDQTIPEDQRFAQATPSGEFWMQVDNPAAAEALELGKTYYIDLTPADAPLTDI